ncbi:hypothetical protein EDD11_005673 [Mortierella claussenii]|nr:hypothetical protein EDD11_005673 [Mortierella claussenii]
MPSTPATSYGLSGLGPLHDDFDSHLADLAFSASALPPSSSSALRRLSFPSLNDYKPQPALHPQEQHPPPPPLTSPQPYTPLTLKSVRAAKSRNKLRQEPHIGVATGIRRNSLAKGSLDAPDESTATYHSAAAMEDLSELCQQIPSDLSPFIRRRDYSTSSSTGQNSSQVLPRPILKDTSARDRMQRESWMSEPPGITITGMHSHIYTPSASRPASSMALTPPSVSPGPSTSPTPVTPPKSLARNNSGKRQSKLSRMSTIEYDLDALTPRARHTATGYGPDYRPRRQSGGPGHLLYAFDGSSTGNGFESEEYDDSDIDDPQQHSRRLQEQYALLQQSHLHQSSQDRSQALPAQDDMHYFIKRGQRKSLGDELNVPPVPEKSAQRKRVSTMGSATLPTVLPALASSSPASRDSPTLVADMPSSVLRPISQTPKERRPHGSIGPSALSFEPLFALKEFGTKAIRSEGQHSTTSKDPRASRLSAVSDADWYTALLTVDPNQQGVSILDLSKRDLTEIPAGLPSTITHLRLTYNMIRIFTPITNLTCLHHLQVLDLCDNHLEILPPEIGLLSKLKELYLSNNKLWKLPDNLQKMVRLEVLDIRDNQLYLLNPSIGRLKALRQLDIRNNHLKSLPAPLCMLSSTLNTLLVDGNQFVQPFADLLQPLMTEEKSLGRPSYLGDDPYADPVNYISNRVSKSVALYEPWKRSVTPNVIRRTGVSPASLPKRRSHSDLMSLMGLQRKDDNASAEDMYAAELDLPQRSHTISSATGAQMAASLSPDNAHTRRERSVSASTVTPSTDMHADLIAPTPTSSAHPLSLNKFLKSIRKSSKSSLKDNQASATTSSITITSTKHDNLSKRLSVGSELDPFGDMDGDAPESESKLNSKGSMSGMGGSSIRRAPSSGINQWVRDRFHKRTNSNELGALTDGHGSFGSLTTDALDGTDGYATRDSGYGVIGGAGNSQMNSSLGSTPDLSQTLLQGRGSGVIDSRFQNKSTGHLPYGLSQSSRDSQLLSSFDTAQRKEREKDYRYSYMSIESQMTQGTENEYEAGDMDAAITQQHQLQQQQQQQQHRLSSVHSPTTPLPSSPVIHGTPNSAPDSGAWSSVHPRPSQATGHIKSLMQYLKDLNDLDPDSSEWEEVYAWRRVWNAERTTATGMNANQEDMQDEEEDGVDLEVKQAKDEEIRLAKLKAQASRRRRIVDEIIATERTYVEGLKGLVEIYLTPALQVMPPGDHKAVFSNAQAIYTFHANHFLPELEKAYHLAFMDDAKLAAQQQRQPHSSLISPASPIPSSSLAPSSTFSLSALTVSQNSSITQQQEEGVQVETVTSETVVSNDSTPGCVTITTESVPTLSSQVEDRIGRVFAEHVPYMKMYSFYINNYDNALRVLQTQLTQAKYKKKMKEFLRRCAKHPNHTQLALQGYLLLPVQRIPRYKLLLQDLLENTWPEHVDHQDIATALEKISSRADEMNERKRQYENHEKVLLVQNRIIGHYKTPLVQPHRKVVREGMLHLIRVVTRNVSMGVEHKPLSSSSATTHQQQVGDLTIHYLSEDTIEMSYLFILFNDIMIQCNPVTGKTTGAGGAGAGSSGGSAHGIYGQDALGVASGVSSIAANATNADVTAKNLELCRVLQLESRLHPAEIIGQDVLRVVDDAMVLYLTGDKDVIHAWKEDINSRW